MKTTMNSDTTARQPSHPLMMTLVWILGLLIGLGPAAPDVHAQNDRSADRAPEAAWEWDASDPRIGLKVGVTDAGEAARNVQLLAHLPRPEGFTAGSGSTVNTDLAFQGSYAFIGNYFGFNIYDVSDPTDPALHVSVVCPGGQGDVSVYGNLLFMSVEETRGRLDCGIGGVQERVSEERLRGVRIFDISNIEAPRQVAAVQTCRGSHTHTLVTDPEDDANVYLYVSGTSPVRPGEELEGCSGRSPDEDPNTSYFRIEVIQVPLAAPQEARVVNEPRIFADPVTGDVAGLWEGGDHGPGTQQTSQTNQCHDITVYPEIGLAAGACSGNGILLDISDPANPVRIDEVEDANFAYWHSATFNNDGTKVIFTDEWGGGGAPRCLATDLPTWGADAIFSLVGGELQLKGYYKLPAPQTEMENCVAHNGSLVPVPGRDIKVQAWYQGGMSVFDFTDPANPMEIAFFDRGPLTTDLIVGGYWSTYWYNGYIYGSEMIRGLDVFALTPSEHLTQNEIDAANLVRYERFNAQLQPRISWPVSPVVARAYVDQLVRYEALPAARAAQVRAALEGFEGRQAGADAQLGAAAAALEADALAALAAGEAGTPNRVRALLASTLRALPDAVR